jgi:hypothetical protein
MAASSAELGLGSCGAEVFGATQGSPVILAGKESPLQAAQSPHGYG